MDHPSWCDPGSCQADNPDVGIHLSEVWSAEDGRLMLVLMSDDKDGPALIISDRDETIQITPRHARSAVPVLIGLVAQMMSDVDRPRASAESTLDPVKPGESLMESAQRLEPRDTRESSLWPAINANRATSGVGGARRDGRCGCGVPLVWAPLLGEWLHLAGFSRCPRRAEGGDSDG